MTIVYLASIYELIKNGETNQKRMSFMIKMCVGKLICVIKTDAKNKLTLG